MEIPRGYNSSINFPVPDSVPCHVTVMRQDTTIEPFYATPDPNTNEVNIKIPYPATHDEGTIVVKADFTLNGQTYTRTKSAEVITPYLDLWDLKDILDTDDEKECWKVEKAARFIINVHCGQSFGFRDKTTTFVGDAGIALRLPERLVRLDKLAEGPQVMYDTSVPKGNTFLGAGNYLVTGSGWFLKKPAWSYDDWDGEVYSRDPIVAPSRRGSGYKNDVVYAIKGAWGYEEVPEPVREAMKLLVNDYACGEQMYRDKFLESMKAADWRLQFNSGAYSKTGNARANLLLSPYVINRMLVI